MTKCKDVSLTLKAVMTKELSIPPFVDISLADLIKKCLNRDVTSRYCIAQVMAHPFLTAQKPRKLLPSALGGKLGLLAAQRAKRTSSQTSQRSGISISSVTASSLDVMQEGKSLDKRRDKETSTYQSLLKDLSKHSATGDDKPRLITTTGMQPCSYSTKNGKISVLKDGSVEVDLSAKKKKVVRITADGVTV